MSQKAASSRHLKGIYLIPQIILLFLFFIACSYAGIDQPLLSGCMVYLVIFCALRLTLLRGYRKGLSFARNGNFSGAIVSFQKTLDFFKKHAWIDNHRYITILSASRFSYQELCLINIGFCYVGMKDKKTAREYYMRVCSEFPGNPIAQAELEALNSK